MGSVGSVRCWVRGGGGLVSITSHAVHAALVVAGPEILIEGSPVAAVECVLLAILVAEVINLTAGLRVSVMPARVAATAVEASVSLVDRHRQRLHSLRLVRFLLQKDRTRGGWAVGSWAVGSRAIRSHWSYWSWAIGSHWSYWSHWSWVRHVRHVGHVIHGTHLRVPM